VPVVIELSEQERACPGCCGLRAHFDDEITEQLDYVRDWGGQFVVSLPRLEVF
jgi:hypothetical protein